MADDQRELLRGDERIAEAVTLLRAGALVAFPTETVYGLGADAANPAAVSRIFAVKGRPAAHPLIVHLGAAEQLALWAREVPEAACRLADAFWPGPLTLVLRRAPRVSDVVTGAQDTVAVRVPGHPLALELLRAFGGGLAAPSANRFGRISPTTAAHVRAELGERVDLILDGGPCAVGLESTILDVSGERPRLLRPGGISLAQLGAVLGEVPEVGGARTPRVSGSLPSHYAPRTKARLVNNLDIYLQTVGGEGRAVLARREKPRAFTGPWLTLPNDPEGYGRGMYAALRELDVSGCQEIVIEAVPELPEWLAVRDRLSRATHGEGSED
jgi:L-threonylcarbamoyladenylate synthase